jgi:hypothetical protein
MSKNQFDVSQFELTDSAVLTVQKPNGDDLLVDGEKVQITLYGPGSKPYVQAKHKFDNATQLRSMALIRGKNAPNAAQENEELLNERLAACTGSISSNFPMSALEIYSNPKLIYIRDQVVKFLDDMENFMPRS